MHVGAGCQHRELSSHSPLSLNLELDISARLPGQQAPEVCLSSPNALLRLQDTLLDPTLLGMLGIRI